MKALQENGIKISAISGTSAGSIVAALFGMGYTTEEMIKLFNYFSKSVMAISPKYLFSGIKEVRGIKLGGVTSSYNIELALEEAAKLKNIKNIQDIKMPIAIPATDLISDREIIFTNNKDLQGEEYINNIEIAKAVRASSTFPGMYAPFDYKKYQFVDGGIFDNLPTGELKKLGVDKVIAIRFKIKTPRKQNTIYNIAMQSLDLMIENLIRESIKISDYVIEIDLKDVKPFSISKLDFCYKEGYIQTTDNIIKIRKAFC
ncbi:MAG: patatin-like phospholipase family protein [Clostridia bacterium]|nr:patatin-like phospholipase family protein [Clostridia bacterium]